MRVKLDENITPSAALGLRALGHDVHTVIDEGLRGCSDGDLWAAVQAEGRFLVTQDLDFSDTRRFDPGTHHGVLLVRIPDQEQPQLSEYITAWFELAEDWERCFVVATPRKVRVRRPEP